MWRALILVYSLLLASINAEAQLKNNHDSASYPTLYLFSAGPASQKFNEQFRFFGVQTQELTKVHLVVVPITSAFLTMGWQTGLDVRKVDQAIIVRASRRFGWKEGGRELLVVLVDRHNRAQLRSEEPVSTERIVSVLGAKRSKR